MPFKNRAPVASALAVIPVFLAVFGLFACSEARDAASARGVAREGTTDSLPPQSSIVGAESVRGLEALHDTVHARAWRGDTLGLLRLFVRDSVYHTVVWPTQPSYEPDRPEMWMLVSGMNKANSNKGLRRLLADVRDAGVAKPRVPVFTRKEVAGGVVHAREKRDLIRGELSLFAAALCQGDGCQVLTYSNAGLVGKPRDDDSEVPEMKADESIRP